MINIISRSLTSLLRKIHSKCRSMSKFYLYTLSECEGEYVLNDTAGSTAYQLDATPIFRCSNLRDMFYFLWYNGYMFDSVDTTCLKSFNHIENVIIKPKKFCQ